VKHGTAALPKGVRVNDVLYAGSLPALFGYFLYLRYGHLTHHKAVGTYSIKALFDSEQSAFEDGDGLFVAHRQLMSEDRPSARPGFFGAEHVGGLGLSISRTVYALGWLDLSWLHARRLQQGTLQQGTVQELSSGDVLPATAQQRGGGEGGGEGKGEGGGEGEGVHLAAAASRWLPAATNAAVFSFSMTFERAALVMGGGVAPALLGRNAFFPNKPDDFHTTCANYARTSLLLAAAITALAGSTDALTWLFWAEVGWQLPIHPASAMFVSNHPSLDSNDGTCQPTASIYLGDWYDTLCCYSNYHLEHHDFPDVPAFRLKALRDAAPQFYSDDAISGSRDGWWETMRRTFDGRSFYACAGRLDLASDLDN